MAVLTLVPAAAVVNIIARVAAVARRWRLQEGLVSVAIEAGRFLVISDQGKASHIVVKLHLGPFDG